MLSSLPGIRRDSLPEVAFDDFCRWISTSLMELFDFEGLEPAKDTSSGSVFHSAESPEWYTPEWLIDLIRQTMGDIDLDVASCEFANQYVKAKRFYTEADNGLIQPWDGPRILCNPPGGLVKEFWIRWVTEYLAGHFKMGIWVGFNIQQLQTLQNIHTTSPLDFPFCIPNKRLKFYNPAIDEKKSRPAHANYILFSGPLRMYRTFHRVFTPIGKVVIPELLS